MADNLTEQVRQFLLNRQGNDVDVPFIRAELKIDPNSTNWNSVNKIVSRLTEENLLRQVGKKGDGAYRVVKQIKPISVFGQNRQRRPPYPLRFPRDYDRDMEMDFAEGVVIREGDLITIGGVKSKGKTTLSLNFAAENIDLHPVLMGNEYSVEVDGLLEPAPRFFNRLDTMSEWVEWTNGDGSDKFCLLPVSDDYPENIRIYGADRMNIVDWINLDGDKSYDIGKLLGAIKKNHGRGITIAVLQKGEGAENPRGGQFVRDFSDLEILLDGFGDCDDDILLTIKGAKEKVKPIVGKTYAYTITKDGTQIINFREVKKCPDCSGRGYTNKGQCGDCYGNKYIDK